MSRIIVFTGKGGVGKTSVAAAHARKASLLGKRVLIVSADMAHNLSDLFEKNIGRVITNISDKLDALEIDPYYEMEHEFSDMFLAFQKMLPGFSKENSGVEIGDLTMFPGVEELFSLLTIHKIYESHEYELIIVDCAPTGETLSLLKFPELFSWYMEKMFPIGKFAMKMIQPISKTVFKLELPNGKAMNDIEKLYLKLMELQKLFKDNEVTSIRLVSIPEKMVVEETKRNYMYLNLYNFNVDALFINRILPEAVDNPFFNEWKALQSAYGNELEEVFGSIPIFKMKWYETDLNGLESLDRVVEDVLEQDDLFNVLHMEANETYEKINENYILSVRVPFANKAEIQLHETGQDIVIRIGNFKRCIPLPDSLRKYCVAGAKLENDVLKINLVKEIVSYGR